MPLTPKQQAYAEARVSGYGPSEAYRMAYAADRMTPKAISVEAARLEAHPKVSLVLREAEQKALARLEVTQERVLREYARIAFADMRRFASVGPDGVTLKDSEDWTDDDAAVVAEVGESRSKDGGSIRFKLHSKTAALDSLARHLGMFPRDGAVVDQSQHLHLPEGLTVEELRRLAGVA